ncbi:MAG: hypothetical protein WC058_07465 [Phycisphaeraceae bacterium]
MQVHLAMLLLMFLKSQLPGNQCFHGFPEVALFKHRLRQFFPNCRRSVWHVFEVFQLRFGGGQLRPRLPKRLFRPGDPLFDRLDAGQHQNGAFPGRRAEQFDMDGSRHVSLAAHQFAVGDQQIALDIPLAIDDFAFDDRVAFDQSAEGIEIPGVKIAFDLGLTVVLGGDSAEGVQRAADFQRCPAPASAARC